MSQTFKVFSLFTPEKTIAFKKIMASVIITCFYSLSVLCVHEFFSKNELMAIIIWPACGFALVCLLLGGKKTLLPLFIGGMIAYLLITHSLVIAFSVSLGNTLEALAGFYLLSRFKFDISFSHMDAFFKLLLAACLSACISALCGAATLTLSGIIPDHAYVDSLTKWWQGDVLGMIIVVPLLLVWLKTPCPWLNVKKFSIETLFFLVLSTIASGAAFLDWFNSFIGSVAKNYWIFLFVTWGAVRFGRHGTLLVISITSFQAILGAKYGLGYFKNDAVISHLNNYWFFMLILSVVGIGLAVTIDERKKADTHTARLNKLYQALGETNQAITCMENEDELFPLVCRCAVEYGGMSMAWICQEDHDSQTVFPVAKAGKHLNFLDDLTISTNPEIPEGCGPIGIVFRENHPVIIDNYLSHPSTQPWRTKVVTYGWKSKAAFPILRNGKVFAVLSVHHEQKSAFDAEAVKLLNKMSFDISFALDNFDREQQRKTTLKLLENSERHYSTLISLSPVGVFEADKLGNAIYVNNRLLNIFGVTNDEAMNGEWIKRIHPSDKNNLLEKRQYSIDNQTPLTAEYRILSSDNNYAWVLLKTEPLFTTTGEYTGYTGTITDISEQKRNEELIWIQANFDSLTHLPNRSMLMDRLDHEILKSKRSDLPLAIIYLDLDHFKEVNDTLGHSKGDELLQKAAQRLLLCVRETDTVARLGGDEFIILMSDLKDIGSVERAAIDIIKQMSTQFELDQDIAYVSASIGITLYPQDGTDIECLLKNADQAMYTSKKLGRNCFSYFTQAMQETAQVRMRIANDLRMVTAEKQLQLFYQPIVNLKTDQIVKAEALLRWKHPEHGWISPADFIPIAEEIGMMNEMGNWVFTTAAKQAKIWRLRFNEDFQISVNVSPVQFRNNAKQRDVSFWFDELSEMSLPGMAVVIEITEGLLMDNSDVVSNKLIAFRNNGMQVSIDDFGTGYSSLAYLRKFDIDYLKIDQSFVRNMKPGSDDLALCEAIISMAHQLDIKVVAEGVETDEQRSLLLAAGCDYGQGYLWSKPLPGHEFEDLIRN